MPQLLTRVLRDVSRPGLRQPTCRSGAVMTTTVDQRVLARDASRQLEDATAQQIMTWAYEEFGGGLVVTSSLTDTVMIHLAEQVAPGIDVIFLDTGYHFIETIGTRDAVAAVHNVNLISVTPDQSVAEQDAAWGKDLFARDPDQCCALRKTQPLDRALKGYTAWASGIRRADSPARAKTQIVTWDSRRKLLRIAPIATWTDHDVARYIEANSLMINPLLEDGYTSIGFQPCTRRGRTDDPRAGRWAGFAKTDCGIHL